MKARKRKEIAGSASRIGHITLLSTGRERHLATLRCGTLTFRCAIGRTGISHLKREGDGATPAGRHRILWVYYRPDRLVPPRTILPLPVLRQNDGWCEDPRHGSYNRPTRLPSSAGHESLWRSDDLYNIVGVLDWNTRPRVSGRGSAIFLHLCRPDYAPTAGCIALSLGDLRRLLGVVSAQVEIAVGAAPRKVPLARRP